jgi:hypothetical protein
LKSKAVNLAKAGQPERAKMVLKIKLYKEKQCRDADAQLFTLQQLVEHPDLPRFYVSISLLTTFAIKRLTPSIGKRSKRKWRKE